MSGKLAPKREFAHVTQSQEPNIKATKPKKSKSNSEKRPDSESDSESKKRPDSESDSGKSDCESDGDLCGKCGQESPELQANQLGMVGIFADGDTDDCCDECGLRLPTDKVQSMVESTITIEIEIPFWIKNATSTGVIHNKALDIIRDILRILQIKTFKVIEEDARDPIYDDNGHIYCQECQGFVTMYGQNHFFHGNGSVPAHYYSITGKKSELIEIIKHLVLTKDLRLAVVNIDDDVDDILEENLPELYKNLPELYLAKCNMVPSGALMSSGASGASNLYATFHQFSL